MLFPRQCCTDLSCLSSEFDEDLMKVFMEDMDEQDVMNLSIPSSSKAGVFLSQLKSLIGSDTGVHSRQ